jgi:hypothetical protein
MRAVATLRFSGKKLRHPCLAGIGVLLEFLIARFANWLLNN